MWEPNNDIEVGGQALFHRVLRMDPNRKSSIKKAVDMWTKRANSPLTWSNAKRGKVVGLAREGSVLQKWPPE